MYAEKIDTPGKSVDIENLSPFPPEGLTKEDAAEKFAKLGEELFELQDLMWGAKTNSALVVLQGRDSAGKDGAIKNVAGYLNPRGVHVASFGVPNDEEREHDFLWRIHRHTPRLGEFAIFNRSHYEDVLIVRVHDMVPKDIWKDRYDEINDFEKTLIQHGAIILKFFLHITFDEQEKRLLAREDDPKASWKLNASDWSERDYWDEYTEAYQVAISRCSSPLAPWFLVPANKKWYRNLVVAEALCEQLRPYRHGWEQKLEAQGALRRAAMITYRREQEAGLHTSGKKNKNKK